MDPLQQDRFYGQLLLHEGLRLLPYTDTRGNITIGVGRNLRSHGISYAESHTLLVNDAASAEAACTRVIPTWSLLSGVRQRVLADMYFNMGNRLLTLTDFLRFVGEQRWTEAAADMLTTDWAKEVKAGRADRLATMLRTDTDYVT
jgi:lysozyme